MNADKDFLALMEQVRQGDAAAAARLRRELELRLVAMVGRALRADSAALPVTRLIRAHAQQVRSLLGLGAAEDSAGLIALVARRVGEWFVDRMRTGTCTPHLLETLCA
jgi:hypothetical protein